MEERVYACNMKRRYRKSIIHFPSTSFRRRCGWKAEKNHRMKSSILRVSRVRFWFFIDILFLFWTWRNIKSVKSRFDYFSRKLTGWDQKFENTKHKTKQELMCCWSDTCRELDEDVREQRRLRKVSMANEEKNGFESCYGGFVRYSSDSGSPFLLPLMDFR